MENRTNYILLTVNFLNRVSKKILILFYTLSAYTFLRLYGAHVGKNLKVTGFLNLYIHPTSRVVIGENCWINSGFNENPVGGYRKMGLFVGSNAELIIENKAGISNSTIVSMTSVRICENAFIGGGCNIYDTDFHSIHFDKRLKNEAAKSKPVVIGSRSFVGGHSTILKGVTIGQSAVIGACSVVASSVPEFEVWAGNPAKFLRKLEEQ